MLLAIDAGNTDVKLGLFDGPELLHIGRVPTRGDRYDYKPYLERFVKAIYDREVEAVIISSVTDLNFLCLFPPEIFNLNPVFVDHTMKTGLTILYDDPSELGADRIVDAVAAVEKYGAPCIVVDFGSATTFNAINSEREFLGGMIVPGIMTAFSALVDRTANLKRVVQFEWPYHVIGSSTYESLQSGWFFGTIDMVDALIKRIRQKMGGSPKVIATGGLAGLLETRCECIDIFDETLTLDGLRILYEMNKA